MSRIPGFRINSCCQIARCCSLFVHLKGFRVGIWWLVVRPILHETRRKHDSVLIEESNVHNHLDEKGLG